MMSKEKNRIIRKLAGEYFFSYGITFNSSIVNPQCKRLLPGIHMGIYFFIPRTPHYRAHDRLVRVLLLGKKPVQKKEYTININM